MAVINSWEDFLEDYSSESPKEKAKNYNKLSISDRVLFLQKLEEKSQGLSVDLKNKFIDEVRQQAVQDFWTHERDFIDAGLSSRIWNAKQIVNIYNLDEDTGDLQENGNSPGEGSIEGHNMLNVNHHPEYAGEWRNIQALSYYFVTRLTLNHPCGGFLKG